MRDGEERDSWKRTQRDGAREVAYLLLTAGTRWWQMSAIPRVVCDEQSVCVLACWRSKDERWRSNAADGYGTDTGALSSRPHKESAARAQREETSPDKGKPNKTEEEEEEEERSKLADRMKWCGRSVRQRK